MTVQPKGNETCNCEEGFKKLGYHTFCQKDLDDKISKLWNFTSDNIYPQSLVKESMIAHHLGVVGEGIFKLYDNPDKKIQRSTRCMMIYLSMSLDMILELMKEIDSQMTKQKEELDGWKSLSSFGNDD